MKSLIKVFIAFTCVISICAGVSGCDKKKKKEDVTLNVITDSTVQDEVRKVADFFEKTQKIKINVEVLPSEVETRDSEIRKLHTEIMAGKGADVYIMDTSIDASDMQEELFSNPYQTMQSGALASLDKYMTEDSYWKDNTYNMKILKAGQYEGKQYIIPISCSYYVFSGQDGSQKMVGSTLGEWLKQSIETSDLNLKNTIGRMLYLTSGHWFQPAINFEKQEVLFDKNKWGEFAVSYLKLCQEAMQSTEELKEDSYQLVPIRTYLNGENRFLQVMPDLQGRKMASIVTYGAVGMSSDYKKEAYEFLMLFLNDKMEEEGEKAGTGSMPRMFSGSVGIPVQKSEIRKWLSDWPEEKILAVEASLQEIEGAYFMIDAERELISTMLDTVEWGVEPKEGWEKFALNLAEISYEKYKMQIQE